MAENKLEDFRVKYPDYDDLEDDELLGLIHKNNYSDMPMDVFREAMGVDRYTEETPTEVQQIEQPRTAKTAIDEKLKSPDTFISNQAPDELESGLQEFEDAEEDPDEPGFISNIGRRAGERAFDVVGDLFAGVSRAMEPIGRPADVALAKLTTKPGIDRNIAVKMAETRPNFFDVAAEHMKEMDFGSIESETYDDLEDKWSKAEGVGDYVNAFKTTVGWGITEGAASIPDMVSAVYALPAYVVSTDARIAQARAENSGREDFTTEDMMAAAPFALGTVFFERFGANYIGGKFTKSDEVLEQIGKSALERGLQVAKDAGASAGMEGMTEFVQEGIIEYVGETWGTDKQLDAMEGFQRGFWGGIAGGTFGGTAGAASSLAGELGRAVSGDNVPPEFEGDPDYRDPIEPDPDEDFGASLDEDVEIDLDDLGEIIDEYEGEPEPEPEPTVDEEVIGPVEAGAPAKPDDLSNQAWEFATDDPVFTQQILDTIREGSDPFEVIGGFGDFMQDMDNKTRLAVKELMRYATTDPDFAMAGDVDVDTELTEIGSDIPAPTIEATGNYNQDALTIDEALRNVKGFSLDFELNVTDNEQDVLVERFQAGEDPMDLAAAYWSGEIDAEPQPELETPIPEYSATSPNITSADYRKLEGLQERMKEARGEEREDLVGEYNDLVAEMEYMEHFQKQRELRREEGGTEFRAYDEKAQQLEVARSRRNDLIYDLGSRFDDETGTPPMLDDAVVAIDAEIETLQQELVPLEAAMKLAGQAPEGEADVLSPEERYPELVGFLKQGFQLEGVADETIAALFEEAIEVEHWTKEEVRKAALEILTEGGKNSPADVQSLIDEILPPDKPIEPTPATPIEGVPEDWKFFDPRMRHPAYRAEIMLKRLEIHEDQGVGSIIRTPEYEGDPNPPVTGRVTSMNPPWVQDLLGAYKMTGKQLRNAMQKALDGKRLGTRQVSVVTDILDEIQSERNDPTNLEYYREELKRKRQERRDAKDPNANEIAEGWIDDVINDNVIEDPDAFWDMTDEEKVIGNLAVLLRAKGFDPVPIIDQSNSVEETVRRLEEALHDYETGSEGLAEAGPTEAGGERAEAQEGLFQDPADLPARQGIPFQAEGWRVDGVNPTLMYADMEAGYPILGQANYSFFKESTAQSMESQFRQDTIDADLPVMLNVNSVNVNMERPWTIENDSEWRYLAVELAGNEVPNPIAFKGTPEERKAVYVEFADNIRKFLDLGNFDGLVVQWDDSVIGDEDANGNAISLLRKVFDQPQMVWFRQQAAAVEAELDRRRGDTGSTDLSGLPLFGTPQDDIFDMPGVDARGEPVGPPAQIQDVETVITELSKVFPDEDYLLPDDTQWPEMMEDMTKDLATPVDVVNVFLQLNAEELLAAEEIYNQMLLARANPTDDTQSPDDKRDRREDVSLREKIAAMSPEERFEAIYMDEKTSLGNERFMLETQENVPFFAFFDVDNLKATNTYLGHEGGDALLERVGRVMAGLTERGTAFHPHGDEFILFGDSVEELEALTAQIDEELSNSFIATEIGELRGLAGTWGINTTIATADRDMLANKVVREETGERLPSGEKPAGLTIAGTTQPEIQKAIMPLEPGGSYVPLVGKYGDLPLTKEGEYQLSDGRVVRIPKRPVRKVHVLKRMQQRFGLSIWEGRIKGPRTELGFYRSSNGEIRTKYHNDLEVSAHEIGHWFDDRFPFISEMYNKAPFKKELKAVSYDVTKVSEGFAEYFRLFFTQEHKAIEAAPYFHEAFMTELVANHPDLYKNMRDLQEMSHAWYLQGVEGRFDSRMGNPPGQPLAIRWWDARHHASDYLLQKIFDGFRQWKQVERDVRGFVADAEFSPYKNLRMIKQSSELTEYMITRGTLNWDEDRKEMLVTGEGLRDALAGVDDQLDNWTRYAVAMRARELGNQGRESGYRPDEVNHGLSFGADPVIREAHARYLAWNKRMMDFYEASGLVGPDNREAMESLNRDYIPFNRVIEAYGTGRVAQQGGVFPRLKGSTRNIKNVLDSIVSNSSYMVHMSLVNEAKQLMYDMLDASPNPQSAANWAVKIPKEVAPVPIQKEQIERAIVQGMGYTWNQWKLLQEGMSTAQTDEEFEAEALMVEKISRALESMPDFVTFWEIGQAPKGNVDVVYRQGEKNYYEIRDALFMDTIQHTSPKAMNLSLKILAGGSALLRRGVVSWPGFQIANFMRDSMQAWTLAKGQKVPMVQASKEVLKGFVDDTDYWAYIINGGGMSTLAQAEGQGQQVMDLGYKPSNVKQSWRNFLRMYDKKLGTFEYGNRIAEYNRQLSMGKSPREAAYQGREISTDFAMRGSSSTVRYATFAITFLNARMQGGYRLGRALFEAPPGQRAQIRVQTALTYFLKGMGIAGASMVLFGWNWGDDRFKSLPAYVRRMNWIVFTGDGEDDYIKIPKPFETGYFWATMWEGMLEYLYTNDEKELADAIVWTFAETFAIDVIPQVVKPIDELRRNKKWTGSPIVPRYLEGVETDLQYQQYTSDAVVKYAKKMGVSPMKAQHLIEGYLGTTGQYALAVADFFTQDQANGGQEIAGPHLDEDDEKLFEAWGREYYSDLPVDIAESILLKRFIDHGPLKRTHQQNKFYELLREARITANSVRLMQLTEPEKLQQYLETVDEGFYFATSAGLEKLAVQINEISAQMDMVARASDMSPIAKRQMIEGLMRQRNMLFKNASEQLNLDDYEKTMEILNEFVPREPDPELN